MTVRDVDREAYKTCPTCKEHKPLCNYYKTKSLPLGVSWYCKKCISDKNKKSRREGTTPKPNPVARRRAYEKFRDITRKKYPFKRRAHIYVNRALKKGLIEKLPCEICGSPISTAHHDSYEPARWLEVRWFCHEHHMEWHVNNQAYYPDSGLYAPPFMPGDVENMIKERKESIQLPDQSVSKEGER